MRSTVKNNSRYTLWYAAASPIHGRGVYAAQRIDAGTMIAKVADPKWIWWISITAFGALVNHQTHGNCELVRVADRSYWLRAAADIPASCELVSDYKKATWPFSRWTRGFNDTQKKV
jgi:SET domain-containing protein